VTARVVNVVLGAWLFVSAFAWPHGTVQLTNAWVCGLVVMGAALIAMRVEELRLVETAVAAWLFVSAFALPASAATAWHNAIVALAMFVVSLVPNEAVGQRRTQLPA
jgi:hypothetical protein